MKVLFYAILCYVMTSGGLRIAVLADIHLDERYVETGSQEVFCRENQNRPRAKYSLPGCDSSERLVDAALNSLQREGPYDAVVILGDIGPHSSESLEMTQRAIAAIADKFKRFTEKIPYEQRTVVLPVIGNNDVAPTYSVPTEDEDAQLVFIAEQFKGLMGDEKHKQFRRRGYYSFSFSEHKVTTLVINANYYSVRHDGLGKDPADQLNWLENQLDTAKAKGERVIFISHIPLGVNAYDESEALHPHYTNHIRGILRRYASVILFCLYGHYHNAYPLVLSAGEEPLIPMFICPSIAPSNYNNPGYYIFHISRLHEIDYDHYALSIEAANIQEGIDSNNTGLASFDCLYRFSQRYRPWLGKEALPTARNIGRLYERMLNEDLIWYQVRAATTSMMSERRSDFLQLAVDKEFMNAYNLNSSKQKG